MFKHNYAKDAHTHTRTRTHARTHALTHTHTHAHTHTHTHTHTHILTHTHTHTHTHTLSHTYTQTYILSLFPSLSPLSPPSSHSLTSCLGGLVVGLADELLVLHEVELIPGVQLPAAHEAGEAVQVVHVFLGAANYFCWRDAFLATRALGAEPPGQSERRAFLFILS